MTFKRFIKVFIKEKKIESKKSEFRQLIKFADAEPGNHYFFPMRNLGWIFPADVKPGNGFLFPMEPAQAF